MTYDLCISVVPVYSAAPSALYFMFRERSQSYFDTYELHEEYQKKSNCYIIVGNEKAGAKKAIRIIRDHIEEKLIYLLIQSSTYNQSSIKGNLIEIEDVKMKVARFINSHI